MSFPICFDIDDTLVTGTGYKFRRAVLQGCVRILDAFAPEPVSPTRLLELQHEYDLALMPKYGFARPRFCRSMVEAYRKVASERGRTPDPRVERDLYRIAGTAFRGPYECAEGAHAVLAILHAWGHRLSAVTIGPQRIQKRKLFLTGLTPFLSDVAFATNTEEKQNAIGNLLCSGSRRGVMVGDSLVHDIQTALAVGAHAVWVKTPDLWKLFDAELDSSKYLTITRLAELLPFIEALRCDSTRP